MLWQKLFQALIDEDHPIYTAEILDPLGHPLIAPATSKGDVLRYYLGYPYARVYLTLRELQVFAHILQGRTMRKTGEAMMLSPRTIEFYLLNMKRKLKCHRKKILVSRVMKSDLMRAFCHYVGQPYEELEVT